ncbi:hypothetical protein Tco_0091209 [Tanacetum coccineum]
MRTIIRRLSHKLFRELLPFVKLYSGNIVSRNVLILGIPSPFVIVLTLWSLLLGPGAVPTDTTLSNRVLGRDTGNGSIYSLNHCPGVLGGDTYDGAAKQNHAGYQRCASAQGLQIIGASNFLGLRKLRDSTAGYIQGSRSPEFAYAFVPYLLNDLIPDDCLSLELGSTVEFRLVLWIVQFVLWFMKARLTSFLVALWQRILLALFVDGGIWDDRLLVLTSSGFLGSRMSNWVPFSKLCWKESYTLRGGAFGSSKINCFSLLVSLGRMFFLMILLLALSCGVMLDVKSLFLGIVGFNILI